MKVGIIGYGFVGKALENGIDNSVSILNIDPKLNTSIRDLVPFQPNIIFICVPTPLCEDLSLDASIVHSVIDDILDYNIDSLLQERHYRFRLYAQLDSSTILYSNILSTFITDLHVTTHNAYISDSIVLTGTIDSLGVLPVTDYGHCWSYLTSNPSINDERISHGLTTTDGPYISVIHSLNNVNNNSRKQLTLYTCKKL